MIEAIILSSIATAILFYMIAYIILPSFNISYNTPVTGISATVLQAILFILLIVILFSFVLMFVYSALSG